MTGARVSVIVATRNSANHVESLLQSVRTQIYPELELIVVDNHSDDMTVEIARRHADRVLIAGPERSAQRNLGVESSAGDYVLIVDSDMLLEPDVVAACVAASRALCAVAVVIPEDTVGSGFWAACRALERSCYDGDETIEAARFFTRDAYLRYRGYDERLNAGEDWDLSARMRKAGEPFGRAAARIHHMEGDVSLSRHLHKKFYYGRTLGTYLRRHPDLAARQVLILRPALLRNWRKLVRRPTLAVGIVFLKAAELGAGALGLISQRLVGWMQR